MNRIVLALIGLFSASSLLLVDSAIKGAVLLLLAAAAAFCLRRDSAATRHLVWLLAILGLLAIPLFSAFLPEWRILPDWAGFFPNPVAGSENVLPATDLVPPSSFPRTDEPIGQGHPLPAITQGGPVERGEASGADGEPFPPIAFTSDLVQQKSPGLTATPLPAPNGNWLGFLPIAWGVGCSLLLLRLVAARFLLFRLEKQAERVRPASASSERAALPVDPLADALEAARTQLAVSRPVQLLIHPNKSIPLVFGILRSRLLLPLAARQWSEAQLRSVLLHELAHIKRRDTLAKLLVQVACALYWFNPLVWLAAWRLSIERERACDDLVLASGVRPSAYASHLLEVVTRYSSLGWAQSTGLAMARKSSLEGRLIAVLSANLNRRTVSATLATIALSAGLSIAVPVAMLRAVSEKKGQAMEEATVNSVIPKDPTAAALLKRWQDLEDRQTPLAENSVARLRRAIDKWIAQGPALKEMPAIVSLRDRHNDQPEHSVDEVTAWLNEIAAIHTGPLHFALNGETMVGAVLDARKQATLNFGPIASNGLSAAISRDPARDAYTLGESISCALVLQNQSTKTIEFSCPGSLDSLIDWEAATTEGRKIDIQLTMYTGEIPLYTWRLKPGEVAQIAGRSAVLGKKPAGAASTSPVSIEPVAATFEVKPGDRVNTHWNVHSPLPMHTGEISFQMVAEDEVEIRSTTKSGKWSLTGGVQLEVEQKLVHASDLSSTAILTWPTTANGEQPLHKIWLGGDAFANRQPWLLAWEPKSTALWVVTGPLQGPREFRKVTPKCDTLRRIDFSNPEAITETTWNYAPSELPKAVQAEIAKTFLPLTTTLPIPEGMQPRTMVSRAEDRRPIRELLQGTWKSKASAVEVMISFPKDETTELSWTINYPIPTAMKTVTDKLTRVNSTNDDSIRLRVRGGKSGNVESMTIGQLKRGIGDTLLLDIWPHADWPQYESAVGIVLQKETAAPTVSELIRKPRSKSDQALFDAWRSYAQEDGIFPGESLKHLRSTLAKFILVNPDSDRTPKFAKLLERVNVQRLWTLVEGDALIEDLKSIDPKFSQWVVREMWMQGGYPFRTGKPLPPGLVHAPWGKAHEHGLRAAWVLEPKADQYPLGTVLKSRVLFHNSGKEPIAFRTPSWHQEPTHKARDDQGNAIQVPATHWLNAGLSMDTIILAPDQYAELGAHGISLGGRLDHDEYRESERLGAWIMIKGEGPVTFVPGPILATDVGPPASAAILMTPEAKQKSLALLKSIINERITRQAPLPEDQAEREQVLRDLTYEFTGKLPSPKEIAAFAADRSADALKTLGQELLGKVQLFTGTLDAAEIPLRVAAADPDAAKKPRVETEPGRYKITDNARVLAFRSYGKKGNHRLLINEGRIEFLKPGANPDAASDTFSFTLPDANEKYALGWLPGTPELWVAEKGLLRRYEFADPTSIKETKLRTNDVSLLPEALRAKFLPVLGIEEKGPVPPKSPHPPGTGKRGVLLSAKTVALLKWSEPVNGLRAALSALPSQDERRSEGLLDFDLVVQNVSADSLRLRTTADSSQLRRLSVFAIGSAVENFLNEAPPDIDYLLQPGEAAILRIFDRDYVRDKPRIDARIAQLRTELEASEKYLSVLKTQLPRAIDPADREKTEQTFDKTANQVELVRAEHDALAGIIKEKRTAKTSIEDAAADGSRISYAGKELSQGHSLSAELMIAAAPQGAWSGKLVTPLVAGTRPLKFTEPKGKQARILFKTWQAAARLNGKIPGGALGPLQAAVAQFIKSNPTYEATPKLKEFLPRIDITRDWSQDDAIVLLDDLCTIYMPIIEWIDHERALKKGGPIQTGMPLPAQLAKAPWGQPHASGLRVAWLLEPGEKEHRLDTPLKSRILFHNTGKDPVAFRALTWNQSGSHQARDPKGAEMAIESTFWTTLPRIVVYRLKPGEFAEVTAAGIGVGPNKNRDDWANTRVGSWIRCMEGDEVTFTPGIVSVTGKEGEVPESGPAPWWTDYISDRLKLDWPLPGDAKEREHLLRRAARDLFGTDATPEEIRAFVADPSDKALPKLTERLAHRKGISPVTGTLQSGHTQFRVLPVDPEAAKKPRLVTGPGQYTLADRTWLAIVRKPQGEDVINEATISFSPRGPNGKTPPSFALKLPQGYGTWAISWQRATEVAWIAKKGSLQKVDFTNPDNVREESFEMEAGKKVIPAPIWEALEKAMNGGETPEVKPAAPATESRRTSFNKEIGETR